MTSLLKIKAWQLFALTIGLPFLIQLVGGLTLFSSADDAEFSIGPFIAVTVATSLLGVGTLLGWFWALGTHLPKLVPATAPLRVGRFKVALLLPLLYIVVILLFVLAAGSGEFAKDLNPAFLILILPLHLLSMACIFYCLRFNAKALKTVEYQRPVAFADYLPELLMLWFYPLGIWVIQPKVNQLFAADHG